MDLSKFNIYRKQVGSVIFWDISGQSKAGSATGSTYFVKVDLYDIVGVLDLDPELPALRLLLASLLQLQVMLDQTHVSKVYFLCLDPDPRQKI